MIASPEYVRVNPTGKRLAITGDFVPGQIKSIVSLVIAVRIGRISAHRDMADGGEDPMREDNGSGARQSAGERGALPLRLPASCRIASVIPCLEYHPIR